MFLVSTTPPGIRVSRARGRATYYVVIHLNVHNVIFDVIVGAGVAVAVEIDFLLDVVWLARDHLVENGQVCFVFGADDEDDGVQCASVLDQVFLFVSCQQGLDPGHN